MIVIWFFIALGLAGVYLGFFVGQSASHKKAVIKTGSVVALAIMALASGQSWLLVCALFLSAIGDWCLVWDGEPPLMLGMAAFGAAHIAYVVLLWSTFPPLWGLGGLLAVGGVMAFLIYPRAGSLRWPTLGYIGIICAMGLAALGAGGWALMAAGLFIISDICLSLGLFRIVPVGKVERILPYVVWCTYWPAQALFAGLAFSS